MKSSSEELAVDVRQGESNRMVHRDLLMVSSIIAHNIIE